MVLAERKPGRQFSLSHPNGLHSGELDISRSSRRGPRETEQRRDSRNWGRRRFPAPDLRHDRNSVINPCRRQDAEGWSIAGNLESRNHMHAVAMQDLVYWCALRLRKPREPWN